MLDDRRCGTCRWWRAMNLDGARRWRRAMGLDGACDWNGPAPFWLSHDYTRATDGTTCPTWEAADVNAE